MIPEPDEATKARRRAAVEREHAEYQRQARDFAPKFSWWHWWLITVVTTAVIRGLVSLATHH